MKKILLVIFGFVVLALYLSRPQIFVSMIRSDEEAYSSQSVLTKQQQMTKYLEDNLYEHFEK